MIGLLQRVASASVAIDGLTVAHIERGLVVLIGVRLTDTEESAARLAQKILKYRVFADDRGKMNLNLGAISGDLLLVPQFTLAADTRHGLRPSFAAAASPRLAQPLFDTLLNIAKAGHAKVQSGVFGAAMQLTLTNDGPVTLWLES